jgi:hypothetical protein
MLCRAPLRCVLVFCFPGSPNGRLAQLVRAPASHAGGPGFESLTAHHIAYRTLLPIPPSRCHPESPRVFFSGPRDLQLPLALCATTATTTQIPVYTGPVKLRTWIIVLVTAALTNGTMACSAQAKVERTTLCNIVNHPSDFIGKTVEIRAQIWGDDRSRFWMNESSTQFDRVCRFLQATNVGIGDGQMAFGTFRGRIVKKIPRVPSTLASAPPKGLPIILIVDESSDIHLRRDDLSGPVPILQLYDRETGAVVRPED